MDQEASDKPCRDKVNNLCGVLFIGSISVKINKIFTFQNHQANYSKLLLSKKHYNNYLLALSDQYLLQNH